MGGSGERDRLAMFYVLRTVYLLLGERGVCSECQTAADTAMRAAEGAGREGASHEKTIHRVSSESDANRFPCSPASTMSSRDFGSLTVVGTLRWQEGRGLYVFAASLP